MKYVFVAVVAVVAFGALLLAKQKKEKAHSNVHSASVQAAGEWLTDYQKAQEQAKATKKPLLLQFTGSDWCPPCRMMQKEVLSTPQFHDYAAKNFVLMEIDFPRTKAQPRELVEQNQTLAVKFQVEAFPTLIILDSGGKKIGELRGYDRNAGPLGYIGWLEGMRKG